MSVLGKMVPYIISMMVKKTDTVMYPSVRAHVPDAFRGALKFDKDLCVGCRLCERVCPVGAIRIEKVETGTDEKRFKAVVRMDKCIFCGLCVDSCGKKALQNTADFELASSDKASLEVEI